MTATDTLRQLLDERGVEHIEYEGSATWWSDGNVECAYIQSTSDGFGQLCFMATPEQAVEATLGRGTCHIVKTWSDSDYVDGWRYRCSECMCFIPVNERNPETGDVISAANYCPNCGRRVEEWRKESSA